MDYQLGDVSPSTNPPLTDKPVNVGGNSLKFLLVAAGLIYLAWRMRPGR